MQTIHGPVNYFKITGEVDGIKKTIHCFCDKHIPFNEPNLKENETMLEPFLDNLFQNSKYDWDFFVEADSLNKIQLANPELYLTRLRNYATTLKTNNTYQNLRVHHADIRWIFSKYFGNDYILEQVKSGVVEEKIKSSGISFIQKYFKTTSDRIKIAIKILKGEEFVPTCEYENIVFKIINKIRTKLDTIQNPVLKECMLNIMNIGLEKLESFSDELLNIKSYSDVLTNVTLLHTNTAFLMDLYLLRRLMDKKYISNVVLYCGSYHAYSLILALEDTFNFEVEYVSKNPFDKTDDYTDILNLLVLTPRIKEQHVEIPLNIF